MKRSRVSAAVVLSIISVVALVARAAARPQLVSRPYDVEAVRGAAAAIQREIKLPTHKEEALAGPLQFIVESLTTLPDLKDVPDEVLDAVVALAGSGRMASNTLIRFGARAVPPLIRSARTVSPPPPYPGGAMAVLQEMLQRQTTAQPLSQESTARVRDMVRDLLNDKQLGFVELAALGCLAVATADPELRAAAERLTDPSVLNARGVPAASQAYVISRIRKALGTLPSGARRLTSI